jgi:hypothetical protein
VFSNQNLRVATWLNFFKFWVFSQYLKAARFPFSRLFAVEFLKSKIAAMGPQALGNKKNI